MSRNSSQQEKSNPQDHSQQYSFYTSIPSEKNIQDQQIIESSSPQGESSSHDVYETNKKKSKRKSKSKSRKLKNKQKNKNYINNKNKSKSKLKQEPRRIRIPSKKSNEKDNGNELDKNQNKTQKQKKTQPTLNKFLGKKSQDQEIQQEETQKLATFKLYPYQANYINRFELFKGYSLQQLKDDIPLKKQKRKELNRQMTLKKFFKSNKKQSLSQNQQSSDTQQDRTYFKSYVVIKHILKRMLESENVPRFFKKSIDEIISTEAQSKYYQKYKQKIQDPLCLEVLEEMVDRRKIINLIEFEGVFNEMIVNSLVFHKYVNDQQMIKSAFQLQQLYHKLMTELSCPQMNQYPRSYIKTTSFRQRPRSKKVTIQGQNREIEFLDTNDLINKHRIKVMNNFLKIICQKNPQNIYTFINRIRNLIQRYLDDKVQVVKQSFIKKDVPKQYSLSNLKQNLSSRSIKSSQNQKNEEAYQISIQCISVSLFQQLKELLKSELRELKRQQNKGEDIDQIYRNELYPHDDSQDFNSDDS